MRKIMLFALVCALLLPSACKNKDTIAPAPIDYKQEMREFVEEISQYAKAAKPGFFIIPQNGAELVSSTGEEGGPPDMNYLKAIDGNGQEDLFYGYNKDNQATPSKERTYLQSFLKLSHSNGNTILVTDYCVSHDKMDDSYAKNHAQGYVSFAADHRELDHIPTYPTPIFGENDQNIRTLSEVKNFLYLINPEQFASKAAFMQALRATNYDLLIMDLFFQNQLAFTAEEIAQLKQKANGGSRLLISYMSIGEAENYRYYWSSSWDSQKPSWLERENPDWPGNYKVKYWDQAWKKIIYGTEGSYLKKILDAGFDGVYLDIIDAFEYFE